MFVIVDSFESRIFSRTYGDKFYRLSPRISRAIDDQLIRETFHPVCKQLSETSVKAALSLPSRLILKMFSKNRFSVLKGWRYSNVYDDQLSRCADHVREHSTNDGDHGAPGFSSCARYHHEAWRPHSGQRLANIFPI